MERSKIYMAVVIAIMAASIWAISQPEFLSVAASHIPSQLGFLGHGQSSTPEDWDLFQHLGGNGPWIQKTDNVVEGGIDVPEGCRVDQVHMVG